MLVVEVEILCSGCSSTAISCSERRFSALLSLLVEDFSRSDISASTATKGSESRRADDGGGMDNGGSVAEEKQPLYEISNYKALMQSL